jgi:hypothetical protein
MDLIEVALTDKRGNAGRESCSLTTLQTMKITLELWDDQSDIDDTIETSMWIMKLNGVEFPEGKNSLMTLPCAHRIVNKILEAEEIAYNEL